MERAEREAIMRQGVVLPETPRERRERAALEEDLQTISLTGRPLPIRARHFRPDAWHELAAVSDGDAERFCREWLATARKHSFDEVNDLIDRHNRWYPVESRLPMDPRTGDHALVDGRDYRLAPLDARWVLARFPAELRAVVAAL